MEFTIDELRQVAERTDVDFSRKVVNKCTEVAAYNRDAKLQRILSEAQNYKDVDTKVANIWENRWYLFHRHVMGLQALAHKQDLVSAMNRGEIYSACMAGDVQIVKAGTATPYNVRNAVVWENSKSDKWFIFKRFNDMKAFEKVLARMVKLSEAKVYNADAAEVYKEEHKLLSANTMASMIIEAMESYLGENMLTPDVAACYKENITTLETITSYKELWEVMTEMKTSWSKVELPHSFLQCYVNIAEKYVRKQCDAVDVQYEDILNNLDKFEIPQNMYYMV